MGNLSGSRTEPARRVTTTSAFKSLSPKLSDQHFKPVQTLYSSVSWLRHTQHIKTRSTESIQHLQHDHEAVCDLFAWAPVGYRSCPRSRCNQTKGDCKAALGPLVLVHSRQQDVNNAVAHTYHNITFALHACSSVIPVGSPPVPPARLGPAVLLLRCIHACNPALDAECAVQIGLF